MINIHSKYDEMHKNKCFMPEFVLISMQLQV